MLSLGRLAHRVQRVWCRGVATFAVGLNSGRWDSATRRTLPATAIKLSNGRLQCDQTDRNPQCLILVPPPSFLRRGQRKSALVKLRSY
jgi:hypothetical protein